MAEIEAAWLADEPSQAEEALARLDELTTEPGREADRGELQRWRRRLGLRHEVPAGCPPVLAAGIRREWRNAAAGWAALGRPYQRALELADSDEPAAMLDALVILDELGARASAHRVRHRLRVLGVGAVPHGPNSATRANHHGLTDRQLTVLHGLARGRTYAETAGDLVVSVRTWTTMSPPFCRSRRRRTGTRPWRGPASGDRAVSDHRRAAPGPPRRRGAEPECGLTEQAQQQRVRPGPALGDLRA